MKKIPVVQQLAATDCGLACVAMVLAYHGKIVTLDDVRALSPVGRDGSTAVELLHVARELGLRGRGVRLELDQLQYLPRASILHWEFRHFVVFDRVVGDHVELVDPEAGRRRVSRAQFGKSFTGVAVVLEPSEGFAPDGRAESHVADYVLRTLRGAGEWPRIVVTSLLLQAFGFGLPVLTGVIVDRVVPRGESSLLLLLSLGAVGLIVFELVTSLVRAHLLLNVRTVVEARMTMGFLEHLVELPYEFFMRRTAGDLLMRLNSNATLREMLTQGVLSALLDGSLVLVYFVVLLAWNPTFAAVVLVLAGLQVGVFLASSRRRRYLMAETLGVEAKAQNFEVEILAGIETLKATGGERRATEIFGDLFVDTLNANLARGRLDALVEAITAAFRAGSPLVVLLVGAWSVLNGHSRLGEMLALNALAIGMLTPVSNLTGAAAQFQLLGSYVDRLEDVFRTPVEPVVTNAETPLALGGRIRLEDVEFRYSKNARPVLEGISLEVEPGTFLGVVGQSGSGKSTLARLLLGLYAPTSGHILYDGIDLRKLDLRALRRRVGVVLQNVFLFGGTIRSNIAHSDPTLALEEVVAAAERACIHEEIMAMPMAYDTPVLDGGSSLSGGQRQRLALARALVGKPALLLLDEATSALDALAEARVHAALSEYPATRIAIAHRLSTVRNADKIVVLDQGRIAEVGNHTELIARRGVYYELVRTQIEPPPEVT